MGLDETTDVPRSIGRVLDVLEVVVDSVANGRPSNLSAIAAATALTPTTALRHLRALDQRGYVCRGVGGSYLAGPALQRIAAALTRRAGLSLVETAKPYLERLAAETGESSYLAVADHDDALYVAMSESRRAIRHVGWAGRRVPLDGSAIGEALRGRSGPRVRVGAVEPDITAVACAVRRGPDVLGALSVVGPSHRMGGATLNSIKRIVADAAASLGGELDQLGSVA